MNAVTYYAELIDWLLSHVTDTDMFLLQSAVTCGALFWLLHRAWLTLWKPVPELISILGVDVPDAPEVSLAGIKADAVTLHWSRPSAHKPVVKYLIQVNGVNVGESSRLETAITVTGLKPGHFYNVRVIAVGNNNFQAGSRVIRLRTYGRDGRPELGNGRVPSNLSIEKPPNDSTADSSDDSVAIRGHGVGIEAATVQEGGHPMARERSGGCPGPRRNTGARRHSPSIDQATPSFSISPEDSMQQLADKLDAIRSDTDDAIAQVAKDTEDYKQQMNELIRERDEKRQILKEKEEASERLKKDVHNSERANRQAQTRKSQKEKVLKDKQAERSKMQSDIVQWKQEIQEMREAQGKWEKESQDREVETEQNTLEIRERIQEVQTSLTAMEEEIRVRGLQIKALEEDRHYLPGAPDDEESRRRDADERYQDSLWDQKQQDLIAQINNQYILCRQLEIDIQKAQSVGAEYRARQLANPLLYQSSSSGVDFDMAGQNLPKQRKLQNRKSRTNTMDTLNAQTSEIPFPNTNAYSNIGVTASPTFAAGPYFDLTSNTAPIPLSFEQSGMSESDIRSLTDGAPLSPTATSLLPAELFTDDEPGSPQIPTSMPFQPSFPIHRPYDFEPQSPDSSSRSASLMSSPQVPYNNMYGTSTQDNNSDGDYGPLNSTGANRGVIGSTNSPGPQQPGGRFLGGIFDFQRPRGKPMQDDGLAFGTLRLNQSQSFPRDFNTTDPQPPRPRRTSFSTGWNSLSFLGRNAAAGGDLVEGNGPAPARNGNARRRRAFNMFSSNLDESHPLHPERDPSSPRPASIASSDLPRPSTDSANFGWPAVDTGAINRNSPLATNWSINNNQPWSRVQSRRPSLTHGSSLGLATGIATEDDDFLPPGSVTHQSSPPPVGVIGTRPSSSHTKPVTPKLNPAAPTFKLLSGCSSTSDKEDIKGKGRTRDFCYSDSRNSLDDPFPLDESSPIDMRKSRDNRSIRTQDSIAESHESLGEVVSNTPSYEPSSSASTKEASFKQLFRKGSSSKFSFTSKGSFFGSKKSTGSGANSEGRGSIHGDIDDDELGRSVDSISASTSSPAGKERNRSINWGRLGFNKKKEGEEEEGL